MIGFVICQVALAYYFVLLARAAVSMIFGIRPDLRPPEWIRPILGAIYGMTEPVLAPMRRVIPQPAGLPIDLSFIILIVVYSWIRGIICSAGLG